METQTVCVQNRACRKSVAMGTVVTSKEHRSLVDGTGMRQPIQMAVVRAAAGLSTALQVLFAESSLRNAWLTAKTTPNRAGPSLHRALADLKHRSLCTYMCVHKHSHSPASLPTHSTEQPSPVSGSRSGPVMACDPS